MTAPTAGRELDALIAEKVMGLTRDAWESACQVYGHMMDEEIWCYECRKLVGDTERVPPAYSTSIADAWTVVERMIADGRCPHLQYQRSTCDWRIEFFDHGEARRDVYANSAPLAICLAALLALEAVADLATESRGAS